MSLADWIHNNESFKENYQNAINIYVSRQIPNLENSQVDNAEVIDWQQLLFSASILVYDDTVRSQIVSLRICQACLQSDDSSENQKESAILILRSLKNYQAIDLALDKNLVKENYDENLDFGLKLFVGKTDIESEIVFSDDTKIYGNKFQTELWSKLRNTDVISVSAPTSAGKSFITKRWVIEYILSNQSTDVVYLVPTRALIGEVELDFLELIKERNLDSKIEVITSAFYHNSKDKESRIFVYTQERLHFYYQENPDSKFNLLIVDEAYKIGDSYRGVVLQFAIEEVVNKNNDCDVVFLSPLITNPESLLIKNDRLRQDSIITNTTTVEQNLFWVNQVKGKPKEWEIAFLDNEEGIKLGQITLGSEPASSGIKRLSYVAFEIGKDQSGNIVYANTAAESEKIAQLLYDAIGDTPAALKDNKEIDELISLCKKTIHPNYTLNKFLKRGIAYHYGNIPILVRSEIERLFSENKINFLICTSTLIEGVNTPCKNIFVRNPKKGQTQPMLMEDFWNLAGRAGRWGKEFQGNIFCVDANENAWKTTLPRKRSNYKIYKSTQRVIDRDEEFVEYIKARNPKANNSIFEYVLSYLSSAYLRHGSLLNYETLNKDDEKIKTLDILLKDLLENTKIPEQTVTKNLGINPLSLFDLYDYFSEHKNHEELLLENPNSDTALQSYLKAFQRISNYFSSSIGFNSGAAFKNALLITNWMRGYPIPRIVDELEKYKKRKGEGGKYQVSIREVLRDVESIARYEAPKVLACYNDILKLYFESTGKTELLEELKDFTMFLEYGANQKTQISLIDLGLSRSSAIEISNKIYRDNMTLSECIKWLNENNIKDMEIPEAVKKEVIEVLENKELLLKHTD